MTKWLEIPCFRIEQPLGTFMVGVMDGKVLANIAKVDVHHLERLPGAGPDKFWEYLGIQRELDTQRVNEIAAFAEGADAAFPTSILVAVDEGNAELSGNVMKIRDAPEVARILDGQHRLAGLARANLEQPFQVVVTFLIEPSWEVQAHVFTSVNANQKRINPSLAKNLLQFARIPTPEKILHIIAKAENGLADGPWYDLIKLVGFRERGSHATLTQHAFIEGLVDLIYSNSSRAQVRTSLSKSKGKRARLQKLIPVSDRRPLRDFYIRGEDAAMREIIHSFFDAVRSAFPEEWGSDDYVLSKTTGFNALVEVLRASANVGLRRGDLTRSFFDSVAQRAARNVREQKIRLDISIGAGRSASDRLAELMLKGQFQ